MLQINMRGASESGDGPGDFAIAMAVAKVVVACGCPGCALLLMQNVADDARVQSPGGCAAKGRATSNDSKGILQKS